MHSENLREDLDNCLIDFKKKVTVSSLLNKYDGCTLDKIAAQLEDYIAGQESKGKHFLKHFLVRGVLDDKGNQVITLKLESELTSFKKTLKNPKSFLYCVEEDCNKSSENGNRKDIEEVFEPVQKQWFTLQNVAKIPQEVSSNSSNNNGDNKVEPKETAPAPSQKTKDGRSEKDNIPLQKKANDSRKESVLKSKDKKAEISNMFKKQLNKTTPPSKSPAVKTPPKAIKIEPTVSKPSPNVFDDSSSDEEDKIAEIKRQIKSDDDDDMGEVSKTNKKRRRISDSDDELPNVKVEKTDEKQTKAGEVKTSTDEEGFIVTVKEKPKKPETTKNRSPPKPKPSKKLTAPAASSSKTKQGNIMSFFGKK